MMGQKILHKTIERLQRENDRLKTTVIELVELLQKGRELSEACRDTFQGTPAKRIRALEDTDRIIVLYEAAIAKHGGG